MALDAAYNLRDQFNEQLSSYSLDVYHQGVWSGDKSRDFLENDWESVPEVVDPASGDGIHHFIVNELFEGIGASDHGYGHRIEYVTPDHDGAVVTNVGAIRTIDGDSAAENLVIHESLHAFTVDHEHGSVRATKTRYTDISPMATSYVRSSLFPGTSDLTFQGTGDVPDEFRGGVENGKARVFAGTHTSDVSPCAFKRASEYLADQYNR